MTAHELAHKLLAGPDLMVTVRGYEGGEDEINFICAPSLIHLDYNTAWYYGKHEYHFDGHCLSCDEEHPIPITQAIHLSSGLR